MILAKGGQEPTVPAEEGGKMGSVCSSLSRNSPEHAGPPCEMVQRQLPRNMALAYDGTPKPCGP